MRCQVSKHLKMLTGTTLVGHESLYVYVNVLKDIQLKTTKTGGWGGDMKGKID